MAPTLRAPPPSVWRFYREFLVVVISVDYRLVPENRFPAAFDDGLTYGPRIGTGSAWRSSPAPGATTRGATHCPAVLPGWRPWRCRPCWCAGLKLAVVERYCSRRPAQLPRRLSVVQPTSPPNAIQPCSSYLLCKAASIWFPHVDLIWFQPATSIWGGAVWRKNVCGLVRFGCYKLISGVVWCGREMISSMEWVGFGAAFSPFSA
jgi:hypothetical protein